MTASTWWYIVGLAVIFGIFFALDIFINSDDGVKPKHKPRATDWFDRPEDLAKRQKIKPKPIERERPKFGGW